jgi:hypothetical protein
MVEAVPTAPYMSISDSTILLSCAEKLINRRRILDKFFRDYDISITSLTNAPAMGTRDYIEIDDV